MQNDWIWNKTPELFGGRIAPAKTDIWLSATKWFWFQELWAVDESADVAAALDLKGGAKGRKEERLIDWFGGKLSNF